MPAPGTRIQIARAARRPSVINNNVPTATRRRRLPAEWEPQRAVMLAWPYEGSDWTPWLAEVEQVYLSLAREISLRESLLILCRTQALAQALPERLARAGVDTSRVRLHTVPYNDTWVRDFGPLTVLENGRPHLLDFQFNGWGGKHQAALDNRATQQMHHQGGLPGLPLEHVDFVLEGGSIDSDGAGTLLTTRRCLLHPARNPGRGKDEIERLLRDRLGVSRILWLAHGGLAGDDTDGHVDMLARFCDPQTIAYSHCEDPDDLHFPILQALARELAALRTRDGRPYRLVPLHLPRAKCDEAGNRLPASYANFLVINGAVLVPVYDDPADAPALEALARCFPGRTVCPIPALPLIRQHGSIHCVTMQLPEGDSIRQTPS